MAFVASRGVPEILKDYRDPDNKTAPNEIKS